jgi:MSHA pilin protein MshA
VKARQQGFTLVELVVVIVVLGILAAIAVPRYASYVSEARIAALNGLAGSLRSSVAAVQARYMANGTNTSPVTLAGGATVTVSTGAGGGIPLSSAGGIDNAVNVGTPATFVYTAGALTGTYNLPTAVANCLVTYTAATGGVAVTTAGC